MTPLRWGVAALALALVWIGAVMLPRVARTSSYFRVRQVEVVGARFLDKNDIATRLHIPSNTSIFDRIEPVQQAAAAIPGVASAVVERRFPGTILVTIHEVEPVAFGLDGDKMVLLDAAAHMLPFDPARAPTSLPLADRDAKVTTFLARLSRADPRWCDSVDEVRADHGDIVMTLGRQRVRVRPETDTPHLRAIAMVRAYLLSHAVPWREIDARYEHRIFVRKGNA